MNVFKITVGGVTLGAVLDSTDSLGPDAALQAWNAENPSYGGDAAETMRFIQTNPDAEPDAEAANDS